MAQDYSSSSIEEIDVLIGLDAYWSLVTGRTRRKKGNPIAVESILGWMLQENSDEKSISTEQIQATSLFITTTEGHEGKEEEGKEPSEMEQSTTTSLPKEDRKEVIPIKKSTQKKRKKKYVEQKVQYDYNEDEVEEDISTNKTKPVKNVPAKDGAPGGGNHQHYRFLTLVATANLVFTVLTFIFVAMLACQMVNSSIQLSDPADIALGECTLTRHVRNELWLSDPSWIKEVSRSIYDTDSVSLIEASEPNLRRPKLQVELQEASVPNSKRHQLHVEPQEATEPNAKRPQLQVKPQEATQPNSKRLQVQVKLQEATEHIFKPKEATGPKCKLIKSTTNTSRTPTENGILQKLVAHSLQWKYILSYSPWWGVLEYPRKISEMERSSLQVEDVSANQEELEQNTVTPEGSAEDYNQYESYKLVFRQCLNGGECYGFIIDPLKA